MGKDNDNVEGFEPSQKVVLYNYLKSVIWTELLKLQSYCIKLL